MKGNRSRDTRPEVLLRSALHRHGLRFRKEYRIRNADRSCRADVVFTRQRLAVFVDGCFWHGCPEHGRVPRSNNDYWRAKLARNRERDHATNAALVAEGWRVLRLWEHEGVENAVRAVERALETAGPCLSTRLESAFGSLDP